jgi:hypothetical protein
MSGEPRQEDISGNGSDLGDCHFSATNGESNQSLKASLALAMAQGNSINKWSRRKNVPPRTAYRWSNDPKVRASVYRIRRRFLERAAGILAKNSTEAAQLILKLGKTASPDSVKLSALRAVFSEVINLTEFATLEGRVAEVEEQIRERDSKQAANSDRAR